MSIPRPRICSVITVPSGGWQLRVKATVAAQYDTSITATIPAGDYFMAGDNATGDFLYTLWSAFDTAANTALATDHITYWWIDDDHKVNIHFAGGAYEDAGGAPSENDVKIEWTALNGPSIAAVLGFDGSADDTSTSVDHPTFIGDWHHGYAWYADEDGYLKNDLVEDADEATGAQVVTPGGYVKTQYVGSKFTNELALQFVTREKMFSGDVGYGTASTYPYERNEGLQCWWKEARQGKRFRVYRDWNHNTDLAPDYVVPTGGDGTYVTQAGKAWSMDPDEWAGCIVYVDGHVDNFLASTTGKFRVRIASVGTSITAGDKLTFVSTQTPGFEFSDVDECWLFRTPFRTYVLDVDKMSQFKPVELPNIDRYDITIPLRRYES